jgi:iron complex outermembrane receptor protein
LTALRTTKRRGFSELLRWLAVLALALLVFAGSALAQPVDDLFADEPDDPTEDLFGDEPDDGFGDEPDDALADEPESPPEDPPIDQADAAADDALADELGGAAEASDSSAVLDPSIEEILVTGSAAMEQPEVETSAMVFSGAELEAARVSDVRDLAEFTPNLEIKTGAGASNATIFIRGIGLNDFNANASSSVAIINDGVVVNSPAGQLFQLFDLEGSDVLRGPQGTLYGRNVTAGAIRVFSRKPSDDFEGRLNVTFGNYDLIEIDGGLTVPLVPDLLSTRLAGRFELRDGVTKNRCSSNPQMGNAAFGACNRPRDPRGIIPDIPEGLPKWVNEVDNWAARAITALTPTDETEFLFNVHVGRSEGDARQNQMRGTRPFPGTGDRFGVNSETYGDPDNDPFAGAYDIVDNEILELFGASLTSHVDFDFAELISITAYEQNDRKFLDNTDAAPSLVLQVDVDDRARQWSEDLRLESLSEGPFEWKAGVFFLTEEIEANNEFRVFGAGRVNPTNQRIRQEFFHAAVFGWGTYHLSDSLRLEGGVRFAWERKQFDVRAFKFRAINGNLVTDPPFTSHEEDTWTPVTGDAVLTWSPTESINFYAKYARGWKTGHFNGGAARPDVLIDPVDPERVNGYEIGMRGEFFDGQLMFDAAVYLYDYKDYQVFALQNQPDGLPLPQLLNAQDVESRGFEAEVQVIPYDWLRWNLALGWVDAKFGTFTSTIFRQAQGQVICGPGVNACTVPVNNDFTGNKLPAAPAFALSTNLEVDLPLGTMGSLTPRIDANYKTKVYFDHQGDDALSQSPYWLLHARLTYVVPGGGIAVSGWVRNILDEEYLLNTFDLRLIADTIIDTYGDPRTYGITVGVNF